MGSKAISYVHLGNLAFIEEMFQKYKQDPDLLDSSWRYFFEGMEFSLSKGGKEGGAEVSDIDLKAYLLVEAYRTYGHLAADIDPIFGSTNKEVKELSLSTYGLKEADLSKMVSTFGLASNDKAPLKDLLDVLKKTYSSKIAIEYCGIVNCDLKEYIQQKIEPFFPNYLSKEDKKNIFHSLNKAELFENFIHTKYVGQKRFSLEGAETLIPMMAFLIDRAATFEAQEIVIGMAHRGRLNVLANILNKSYEKIFHEFEDHYFSMLGEGTGDVKYHKGFQGDVKTLSGNSVKVTLAANPSHLESVDPLVEGRAKALQEIKGGDTKKVVPLLIHGDASVAGQGVVYETLQLSRLEGYSTGGTIHIIINNQIGFTTTPKETRSTTYCTDIAKAFNCPIFHVNAEDPESCVWAALFAVEIRQKFGIDVFIDLNCYRKYGHNEADEPAFTQPVQYSIIRAKKSIRSIFMQTLVKENVFTEQELAQKEQEFKDSLQRSLQSPLQKQEMDFDAHEHYANCEELHFDVPIIDANFLVGVAESFCKVPQGFQIHPKVQKLFSDRLSALKGDPNKKCIDWGGAEYLSFASILLSGIHIRLSGQDCQRGTFSQRHAAWFDQATANKYFPLSNLAPGQAPFQVLNSPLSEYAVLGFDMGYSLSYPNTLTIWEAQYGDFANTAQVIIDQYISSSDQKWNISTNLTMLLPHGYEGQGPEHSSARMERYLQLAAQGNMIIANCSTPSQYFHILRRQAFLKNKKPMIIFSPKALLRHPLAQSSLNDLASGSFHEVLIDEAVSDAKTVLLCSGKVYYDLLQEREKLQRNDVAIIRIEQLYPFPKKQLEMALCQHKNIGVIRFVQEEHSNMGAWEYLRPLLQEVLGQRPIAYVGRPRSAATAVGSYSLHKKQFQKMMDEAFS